MKKSKQNQRKKQSLSENNVSLTRNLVFSIVFVIQLIAIVFLSRKKDFTLDEQMILYLTYVLIYGLSIYVLMYERRNGYEIYRSTSYKRWGFFQIIEFFIVLGIIMTKTNLPVLTFAGFLLVPSSGPMAAFLVETFDVMMIYFFTEAPSGYMVYLLIQAVTGITFAFLFKEKLRRREKNVALVLSFFSYIGILFFLKAYTLYHQISLELVLSVFIGDIIFTLFVDFIYPYIVKIFSSERDKVYREIMSKNYPLRREIRDFSKFEYDHALKVSYFAGKCAFETGCSISTAKAGGLYYRFPKLFDKDVNSDALKILEDHCFPMEVMDIIYEYGGDLRKPSSPESAIVHMVDAVITRIEILDEETMKSSWNQDMVIYSILNDLSGKGMYDQSQLSLNQYLKIRDYLVNANLLINIEED